MSNKPTQQNIDDVINFLDKTSGHQAYRWSFPPESLLIEYNLITNHEEMRLARKDRHNNVVNILTNSHIDIVQFINGSILFTKCVKRDMANSDDNGVSEFLKCVDDLGKKCGKSVDYSVVLV